MEMDSTSSTSTTSTTNNNNTVQPTACLVIGMAGSGKCLSPSTPVLMYDGSVRMARLVSKGDLLMGEDSTPRRVLSTCTGVDTMYRILPTNGRSFVCNEPHVLTLHSTPPSIQYCTTTGIWAVDHSYQGNRMIRSFTCEMDARAFLATLKEDIFDIPLEEYLTKSELFKKNTYLYHTGVQFAECHVPVDPYLLGYWLVAHDARSLGITASNSMLKDHLIRNGLQVHQLPNSNEYHLSGMEGFGRSFMKAVTELNLSNRKHIPECYKINSAQNRLLLLSGLIDGAGCPLANSNYCIGQLDKRLANDIEFLVLSLGFMATVERDAQENADNALYHVNIINQHLQLPFDTHEISHKPLLQTYCQPFTVQLLGRGPYYGFELDGNGRFLLGDFKVTHNTTLMQRLTAHLHAASTPAYVLNLDPAVKNLPYGANIDIRDTIKYKEIMKQYNLGPNGAIMTSLNLFATRFDQVMNFVDKKAPQLKYILVDTPGQIEVFTWSASGTIITEGLASTYPTVVIFVVDTSRCTNTTTFMSNMLYACSVLYKTKLPFIVVFNKTDVVSHQFALKWMTDFDAFQEAMQQDSSYMSSLTRSMSLVLEEFYHNLRCVGVSAVTGYGVDDLFDAIQKATEEYQTLYKPDLEKRIAAKKSKEEERKQAELQKLKTDMQSSKGQTVVLDGKKLNMGKLNLKEEDQEEEYQEGYELDEDYNSEND